MEEQVALYLVGAIGVPLLLWWFKGSADRADKAQAEAHSELKGRVKDLERCMGGKADKEDVEKRLDRGSEKFEQVLDELKQLNRNVSELAGHFGVELAKRPTHDEVARMLQQGGRN